MPDRYADQHLCALKLSERRALVADSVEKTENFYRNHPTFTDLAKALATLKTPQEILGAVGEYITVDSLKPLIRHELRSYQAVPWYNSPALALDHGAITGWTLFSHAKVLVTLIVIDAVAFNEAMAASGMPPTIRFAAGYTSLSMLSGKALHLDGYSAAVITDKTPVHAGLKCSPEGDKRLTPGETLTCRGGSEALVYRHAESSAVLLQSYCRKKTGSVMADYDSRTLSLKKIVAADQRINRLQVVSSLARLFAHPEAAIALKALTDHPEHYVRWQAARELTALSPVEALPILTSMAARDRNPGVRNNAARTIGYLSERGIRAA
ncbi:HEAT repeat domain-containing protein [Parvularcula flava]|uniref:HEAT repeat domain-containing protein n=1 Tax=Aquisalinus luteolus TaxID=1566827 RepID=A0A8J3A1H3_9PROT|nr:HEAT repeat domain-containing protein [Aquisalinus luteolus]NHK27629.1 HEAT repeat domain-containing protein [Aquisalinus luteolus]GGH96017.1 hypothetical protein GCM10011355_13930 [Aquisalinus luteolus]